MTAPKRLPLLFLPLVITLFFPFLVSAQGLPPDLGIKPKLSNGDTLVDTIYQSSSGAAFIPKDVLIGIRISTQGQAQSISVPLDVLLAIDLSGSMNENLNGHWKLTAAQNAARHFIDSLRADQDRVALFGWAATNTNTITITDSARTDWLRKTIIPFTSDMTTAKQKVLDSMYIDNYTPSTEGGTQRDYAGGNFVNTPMRTCTMYGLKYLLDHGDPVKTRVLIMLTDGANNDNQAINPVIDYARTMYQTYGIRTYMIACVGGMDANMQNIATAGGGRAYLGTTAAGLDSIFQAISGEIRNTIAKPVPIDQTSNYPMLTDVLPAPLDFVNGSEALATGNTVTRTFAYTAALKKLDWQIPQVVVHDSIAFNYRLSGNTPGLFDIHVTKAVNPANYTRAYYNNYNSNLRDKEFPPPHKIMVLNAPGPEDIRINATGGDRLANVTIYLDSLQFSAARTIYLYWRTGSYITNPVPADNDTSFPYSTLLVPGQNTVTIPGLNIGTTYYFTVAFENAKGVRSAINSSLNGDTAITAAQVSGEPLNYMNIDAIALSKDSIMLRFKFGGLSSNIFDTITQIGVWYQAGSYPAGPVPPPTVLISPRGGAAYFPTGTFDTTLYFPGLQPNTTYYFCASDKNIYNWAHFNTGSYPHNRDSAKTLPAIFVDTLRAVFIRVVGEVTEVPELNVTLDSSFSLEGMGVNLDAVTPKTWGVAGQWSFSGFDGSTVKRELNASSHSYTFIPGNSFPPTNPGSGYIYFRWQGITADSGTHTFWDSVRINVSPGKPAGVHITTLSAWRAGNPLVNPSPSAGPTIPLNGLVDTLMAVYLDKFNNYSDTIPSGTPIQWSLPSGLAANKLNVSPSDQSITRVTKVGTADSLVETAVCQVAVTGKGTDQITITMLKSEVTAVVFVPGTPTKGWVEANWTSLVADTLDTVYTGTGLPLPVFSAWIKLADGTVMPMGVNWDITTVRNQSAYGNLYPTSSGLVLQIPDDFKWSTVLEDKITVNPGNSAITQSKWLLVLPGLPWVAVDPPDSIISADANPSVELRLPTTDYGVDGQLYTTKPVTIMVNVKIIDKDTRAVLLDTMLNSQVFYDGQSELSLQSLHRAGTYQVIVSGSGTIDPPAGSVDPRPDTTEFVIKSGAPASGRVLWVPGSTPLQVSFAPIQLLPGQDSASTYFQMTLYDQYGNKIDSLPGIPGVRWGVPAVWYHDSTRADSTRIHRYVISANAPNDTVRLVARFDTVTASILVIQSVPVFLQSVTFFDRDHDGRVDSLKLIFTDQAALDVSSMTFERSRIRASELRPYSAGGTALDRVWLVGLNQDSLPYNTGSIPAIQNAENVTGTTSYLGQPVVYIDSAPPVIYHFYFTVDYCGENEYRDKLQVDISEPLMIIRAPGDTAYPITTDDLSQVFTVYDAQGSVQVNPPNDQPVLADLYLDDITVIGQDTLIINLENKMNFAHSFSTGESRIAFLTPSAYTVRDRAGNPPVYSQRTALVNNPAAPPAPVCKVNVNNTGSSDGALNEVTLNPDGSIKNIIERPVNVAVVQVPGVNVNIIFSVLNPAAANPGLYAAIASNPATATPDQVAQLKQALRDSLIGFRTDVAVYDLLGQLAYHKSYNIYPTDFIWEGSFEDRVDKVVDFRLYQKGSLEYSWERLSPEARGKLAAWHFRNDKGRPVSKGAYLMRVFFNNAQITQDNGGRMLMWEGPILHKGQ